MKRTPVDGVKRGDSCAMAVRPVKRKETFSREDVRRGMVMVDNVCNNVCTGCGNNFTMFFRFLYNNKTLI